MNWTHVSKKKKNYRRTQTLCDKDVDKNNHYNTNHVICNTFIQSSFLKGGL